MEPLVAVTFLHVIWWMLIVFFWMFFLWIFVSVFADIFRRDDISGWGKAGWILLIVFLPLLGVLIYVIARPAVTPADEKMIATAQRQAVGYSPTAEIEKAKQLKDSGAITDAEFQALKQRALS